METDWFTLRDARLQLLPTPAPHGGGRRRADLAGRAQGGRPLRLLAALHRRHDPGRLRPARRPLGRDGGALGAVRHGHRPPRLAARAPVHVAETKEQAYADVQFGLAEWVDYFKRVAALPLAPETDDSHELADDMNASGFAVIGTPDDVAEQIQRLVDQSGGFGTFLCMGHDWADRAATHSRTRCWPVRCSPASRTRPAPPPCRGTGRSSTGRTSSAPPVPASCPPSSSTTRRRPQRGAPPTSLRSPYTSCGRAPPASWERRRSNSSRNLSGARTARSGNAGKQVVRHLTDGASPPG